MTPDAIRKKQQRRDRDARRGRLGKGGGISLSALERWIRRPELAFPKPRMIGQRRFWVEAEILAWLESREVAA
ncbi:AlpA family phage regulatory protein [Pseudomonas sp. GX19020]|uniref:helix-turn-helix transcriptional regulator n=1 Tax=Pseudomonas sp. GX19020 TaxID=2942277 RepID=UPI002018A5E1|nr:AlpA family phage regulatory protein [Pseudomonas sp. GX19020]MCL4065094.1 AlpA family phage regulatory protein [Pseudomonas sp. GX19020]